MTIKKSQWIAALTALPKTQIKDLAKYLSSDLDPQPAALPRSGLQLLAMKDGVMGETYFLGEIQLATAHISLQSPEGARVEGAASVLEEDEEYAMALAILDAIMRHDLPGSQEVADLIEAGWRKRVEIDNERGQLLARTKVDFSLMSES